MASECHGIWGTISLPIVWRVLIYVAGRCCCVNLCTARNIIRYQYRVKGNDFVEECAIPYGLKFIGDIFGGMFPPIWLFLYGLFVAGSMQLTNEVESRQSGNLPRQPNTEGRYLAGYHPIPINTPQDRHANGVAVFSPFAASAPINVAPAGYYRVSGVASAPECEMGHLPHGVVMGVPIDSEKRL